MKALWLVILLLLGGQSQAQQPTQSLPDLRKTFENRTGETLNAALARELGTQALALASQTTSRGSFWSILGFVSELCGASPSLIARELRAEALTMLADRPSNSMRWSSLITKRFIPNFRTTDVNLWSAEIEDFDRTVDKISKGIKDDQTRAELLYAKALVRITINRHWNWLTPTARLQTIALLDSLNSKFGSLHCPGQKDLTIQERSNKHLYELEKLYFGAPAPVTATTDLLGQELSIGNFRGEIVVLDFWTSFCQPCLAMVPEIKELLTQIEGQPVEYLGVNGDRTREEGLNTAKRYEMGWQNFWDGPTGPSGPLAKSWSVRGWPSVFVIDAQGKIRYKLTGSEIPEELGGAIESLLKEMAD